MRGMICGFATFIGINIFVSTNIYSYTALIFYTLMGSIMMGSLGTMVGIWADKWDQQQGITNFIVLPMTFLSGTFYSISRLPEFCKNFDKNSVKKTGKAKKMKEALDVLTQKIL